MKRVVILFVLLLSIAVVATAAPQNGTISGTAKDANSAILSGVKVQLRNADTGMLVSSTQSGADGTFQFANIPAGNYIVEIVDNNGNVVGVSPAMTLGAGQTLTGMTVASTAAGIAAAGGGGFGAFFGSTAGILTGLAVLGAVTAGVIVAATGSASR
jgi:hypothetical protein